MKGQYAFINLKAEASSIQVVGEQEQFVGEQEFHLFGAAISVIF